MVISKNSPLQAAFSVFLVPHITFFFFTVNIPLTGHEFPIIFSKKAI